MNVRTLLSIPLRLGLPLALSLGLVGPANLALAHQPETAENRLLSVTQSPDPIVRYLGPDANDTVRTNTMFQAQPSSTGPGDPIEAADPQATYVSGAVSGTWTLAGSPYIATGDLKVESGATLTIQAGVQVRFQGKYRLTVEGSLLADGMDADQISFSSGRAQPRAGDWYGIRFHNCGDCGQLDYVQVEYAEVGIEILAEDGIASPDLDHLMITHSSSHGIGITAEGTSDYTSAAPQILYSTISRNGGDGIHIYAEGGSADGIVEASMRHNTIEENTGAGIYLYGRGGTDTWAWGMADGYIYASTIASNGSHGIEGHGVGGSYGCFPSACIGGSASPNVESNVIADNGGEGIHLVGDGRKSGIYSNLGVASPGLRNNIIVLNAGDGLKTNASDSQDRVLPEVINNTFVDNGKAGIQSTGQVESDFVVYNNLFVSNRVALAAYQGQIPDVGCNGLWDNNRNYTNYPSTYGPTTITNPNGDPSDVHYHIYLDPRFVDGPGRDYHLRGDSPAIEAGCSLYGPYQDIDEDRRPKGARYDLGVDEVLGVVRPPELFFPLKGGLLSDPMPTFQWEAMDNATGYRIQVDDQFGFPSPAIDEATSDPSYAATVAHSLGNHYWRAKANYGEDEGYWSDAVTFAIMEAAQVPFEDGFESGRLGPTWHVSTTGKGRVRIDTTYAHAGRYSLLLDASEACGYECFTAAELMINLAGHKDVELSFWGRSFFFGAWHTDGVYLSDDHGATWHKVFSFYSLSEEFTQVVLDIDELAADKNLVLNDHFLVRFYAGYGRPIPDGGFALDEVRLTADVIAPSHLEATAASETRLHLNWQDNSPDESAFHLERNSPGGIGWQEIGSVAANVTTFEDTGLDCGTTYDYRVRAYRSSDEAYSDYSGHASATTAPCKPTNLAAVAVSPDQIDLAWDDNSLDETAFCVERSPDGVEDWTEITCVNAGVTDYNDTGLDCETTFSYRVRSYRDVDDLYSDYGSLAQATTWTCPPLAPSNMEAMAVSESQLDLTWQDNSADETAFHVERSPDGSAGWTEIGSVGVNVTSYEDTGLDCGTTYHYRVRAFRSGDAQYSGYSDPAQASTQPCPPPDAPSSLVATAVSRSQIDLTWQDNSSDETAFHVERSLDGSTGWTEIGTVGVNVTSYEDTGLDCGTTYHYRVRAFRSGDSEYSNYTDPAQAITAACPIRAYLPLVIKEGGSGRSR